MIKYIYINTIKKLLTKTHMKKSLLKGIIIPLFFFFQLTSFSQGLAGWSHSKQFSITDNSGSTTLNTQVQIVLNTQALISANEMKVDGSDIRFAENCDGSSPLNYWIENGINTPNTTIWVKLPSLGANETKSIYMFYGNPNATAGSDLNNTFNGPHSATDSVSGGNSGSSANSQRGFRFKPNQDILVTHFGKRTQNSTNQYVTLFDFNTQSILRQTSVPGTPNVYTYIDNNNPIWLNPNTEYLVTIHSGSSDGYLFGAAGQSGQHITYLDMRYCNNCNQNTFPTSVLSNIHYGYVDFWYYLRNKPSVEPTITETQFNSFLVQIDGENSICLGESTLISANISGGSYPYNYTWTSTDSIPNNNQSAILVSPTQPTIYNLHVTDALNCSSNASIQIDVLPVPTVEAGEDQTICEGTISIVLASGNAESYSWSNGVINGMPFSPSTTTTYYLTGVNSEGCESVDSLTINVLDCSSIENHASLAFEMYPNPTSQYLNIKGNWNGTVTLNIYDVTGRKIKTQKVESDNNIILDVTDLSTGVYKIECKYKGKRSSKSFVKN